MKRFIVVVLVIALVMIFMVPVAFADKGGVPNDHSNNHATGHGNQGCSFGGQSAANPGHYFQFALDYAPWNPPGEWHGLGGWIAAWWEATAGANNAPTVGAFIQRDCKD